jgi:hypothetical protein
MTALDMLSVPVTAALAAYGIYESVTGSLRDGIYLILVGTIGFAVSSIALLKRRRRGLHEHRHVT